MNVRRIRKPSPVANVIRRTLSVLVRLTGHTLFSIGFALSCLPSSLLGFIGKVFYLSGLRLIFAGKTILFPNAESLLKWDDRPLVLYLRAFRNAGADEARIPIPFYLLPFITTTSDEERLAQVMNQIGPFIAIGEPKERGLRDLGAARMYVDELHWKDTVIDLINRAQLIVLRVDPAQEKWGLWSETTRTFSDSQLDLFKVDDIPEGVWWELGKIAELVPPERVLVYLPFKGKPSYRENLYEALRSPVEKHFGRKLPEQLHKATFIGFHDDGTSYLLTNTRRSLLGVINWRARTLEPFFARLGVVRPNVSIDAFRVVELLFGLFTTILYVCAITFTLFFLLRLLGLWGTK